MRTYILSRDTIKLLRIPFSLYLVPVFLLSLSQAPVVDLSTCAWSFFIIHFLVYPSSNGYNSYIDRDENSIGGLEHPPLPSRELFYVTLVLDVFALCLAVLVVNPFFALCIFLYISASRAYSSKQTRLKKYPLTGFLVVIVFQGAFTYYMSYAGITNSQPVIDHEMVLVLLAASLQIAGAYPLTQVYQHEADKTAGVRSLSMLLGTRGTFVFTGLMFVLCNLFYWLYFSLREEPFHFILLQMFFIPVIAYFLRWSVRVYRAQSEASFKNAMRMNMVASVCSSACFIFFILLKL
jgi:4-hydroxybenzoate polyprenyltransferase